MTETPKVLVIESDDELSHALAVRLESEGFRPQLARNRTQAFALLRNLHFDVIFSDVLLSDGDGEQCYLDAIPFLGSTPVIFATAAARVDQVVRLLKAGVVDCLQIPYDMSDLIERLRGAIERQAPRGRFWPDPIMVSPAMRELGSRLKRLAATNVNFVVTGEAGTGKETIARYLHRLSPRADEPFIEIACASLGGSDGERFLFGERIRSSDESSGQVKAGVLEEVGRGTLFLNEIEDIAPALQNRLAQVMDEDRLRRLGDIDSLPFEGRIIAATELSGAGLRESLRPSLFHRLAVLEIEVPPLRERQADLGPLTDILLQEVAAELGVPVRPIEAEAMSALSNHDWPGNVRELRNRLLRAMSFASSAKIGIRDLFPDIQLDEAIIAPLPTLEEARSGAERQRIVDALTAHDGRIGHTAHSLGISRVTLWGKMKRLGLSNGADSLFLTQKVLTQKKSQSNRVMTIRERDEEKSEPCVIVGNGRAGLRSLHRVNGVPRP